MNLLGFSSACRLMETAVNIRSSQQVGIHIHHVRTPLINLTDASA